MNKFAFALLVAGTALVAAPGAHAALSIDTDLFAPVPVPGTATPIAIQSAPLGNSGFVGAGFTLAFSGVPATQGVVQGQSVIHAIPVAGAIPAGPGGQKQFLTGDFGSALTTSEAASGKYLSTGGTPNTITITFTTGLQSALGLLWGSIDTSNNLEFFNGAVSVGSVTGAQVQLTPGFTGNGDQGPGGSSYVTVNSTLEFNRVVASSNVVSFEFTGVVGSTTPISVPEPISLALLGTGLTALGMVRRRRA